MKVIALDIRKREQYDSEYPNEIVGIVQIVGDTGKMEVRLFPKTVACDNVADTIELQISNGELKQIAKA